MTTRTLEQVLPSITVEHLGPSASSVHLRLFRAFVRARWPFEGPAEESDVLETVDRLFVEWCGAVENEVSRD